MLQHYWYLGAVISAVYSVGACMWTFALERRICALQASLAALDVDVALMRGYVIDPDNAPTGNWRAAKRWPA